MRRVRFTIKRPGDKSGRKTFAIVKDVVEEGVRKQCQVVHPTLTEINSWFVDGKYSLEESNRLVERLCEAFRSEVSVGESGEAVLPENEAVLEEFWENIYSYREMNSETLASARNDLRRAVRALGNVCLRTASRADIQNKLDREFKSEPAKQRRAVMRVRQVLSFLGREQIKLRKMKEPSVKVKYITESNLEEVLLQLESPTEKALIAVCFYTGCRIGEAFALTSRSLVDGNGVFIETQMYKDGTFGKTKNRKPRETYLFDAGIEWFKKWTAISLEERIQLRNHRWSEVFKKACIKAGIENVPDKFHDLRHSYALHMLGHDVGLSDIALSLGDHITVCQKYYVGFTLTPELRMKIDSKVRQNKARAA